MSWNLPDNWLICRFSRKGNEGLSASQLQCEPTDRQEAGHGRTPGVDRAFRTNLMWIVVCVRGPMAHPPVTTLWTSATATGTVVTGPVMVVCAPGMVIGSPPCSYRMLHVP